MLSRRDALKTAGAVAAGAVLAGSETAAQEKAVKLGKLKQSVCRWCYQRIPLEDFLKSVADLGLPAVDLLQPEEFAIAAKYGLTDAWYGALLRRSPVPIRLDPAP